MLQDSLSEYQLNAPVTRRVEGVRPFLLNEKATPRVATVGPALRRAEHPRRPDAAGQQVLLVPWAGASEKHHASERCQWYGFP